MTRDVPGVLARLESSVRRITWAIVDCDDDEKAQAPAKGQWSPIQILAHVKACDDIITSRIAMILTRARPTLLNFDEHVWAEIAGYVDAPDDQTLMAYQRHRGEMVWQLRRLPDEAWDYVGVHETRGELTLYDLVNSFLEHEEEHVANLETILEIENEETEEEPSE